MLSVGKPIPDERDKQHDRYTYEAGNNSINGCIQNPWENRVVRISAVEIVESSKNAVGGTGKSDERRESFKNSLSARIFETNQRISHSFG
jgi:hypothetical protein